MGSSPIGSTLLRSTVVAVTYVMTNTDKRIREQLGMPIGTAQHRLRMQIMFQLVQETQRDACFVCGDPITSVDELSIEHKLAWLGEDTQRFWDLDNIAFSHRLCNRPRTSLGPPRKHPTREGYEWCRHHECEHPVSEFGMRTANGKRKPRVDCKRGRVERHQLGLPS